MGAPQEQEPQEEVAPEPAPPSPWRARILWGLRVGLQGGVGLGVLGVAAALFLIWPYLRDDLLLDRVVLAVALDWRDFGRDKAQARLEYELDHQGIGLQVADEDCALVEAAERGGEVRRVHCQWTVQVPVPLLELRVPLAFESLAEIDAEGDLRAGR